MAAITQDGYEKLTQSEERSYGALNILKEGSKEKHRTNIENKHARKGHAGASGTAAFLTLSEAQPEHITNLALFGLERSDGDLNWKWSSVGDLISERNDPSRPPVKGCNKKFLHWKLRRTVENIYFRLFTFIFIFVDIGLVVAELAISCSGHPASIIIRNLDLILSTYFLIEVT